MLKLATVFEDATGKNHRWTYNEPDPNKSPEEIRAALETLTTLNLFEKDGVRQFCKVVSAKFVETIETPLFDLRTQPETYVADPNNAFAPFIVADEVVEEEESKEQPTAKPVETPTAVEVDQKAALEAIEAVTTSKSVLEKVGIHSQAKAALDAAIVNPTASATTKEPVVTAETIEKVSEIESEQPDQELEADTTDTKPAAPVARPLSPVQARKERIDRLRAYHEANKKKQKRKKGKKKKR